jgi:hypothetical protein
MHNKLYAVIFVLALVCAIVVAGAAVRTKWDAEVFLCELQDIQLGPAGLENVQAIASQFRNHVTDESKTCARNECSLTVTFQNTLLGRLHLATPTTFGAVLLVRDGRLYYINAAMRLYSRNGVISASTTLSEQHHDLEQSPYTVITRRGSADRPWEAIIHLTPMASASERRDAFLFDLSCLDKVGGCRDSSDLLPSAWASSRLRKNFL